MTSDLSNFLKERVLERVSFTNPGIQNTAQGNNDKQRPGLNKEANKQLLERARRKLAITLRESPGLPLSLANVTRLLTVIAIIPCLI